MFSLTGALRRRVADVAEGWDKDSIMPIACAPISQVRAHVVRPVTFRGARSAVCGTVSPSADSMTTRARSTSRRSVECAATSGSSSTAPPALRCLATSHTPPCNRSAQAAYPPQLLNSGDVTLAGPMPRSQVRFFAQRESAEMMGARGRVTASERDQHIGEPVVGSSGGDGIVRHPVACACQGCAVEHVAPHGSEVLVD